MMSSTETSRGGSLTSSKTNPTASTLSIVTVGASLSAFLAISFGLCVLGYLLFPNLAVPHGLLLALVPGFSGLTWATFFVGLGLSIGWGWYIAVVFVPLYRYFAARQQ